MCDTGIYAIVNIETSMRYIGSTLDSFRSRWETHLSTLRAGKHINIRLQSDWNRADALFEFEVLEVLPKSTPRPALFAREQHYIAEALRAGVAYNIVVAQTVYSPREGSGQVGSTEARMRVWLNVASDLLSVPEVAQRLNVSETIIRRLVRKGVLKPAREGTIGRQTRRYFHASDVEELRQQRGGEVQE